MPDIPIKVFIRKLYYLSFRRIEGTLPVIARQEHFDEEWLRAVMRPNDRMFADEVFCSHVLQRESSVNVPPLLRHLVPPMRWFQYRLPLAPEQIK